MRPIQFTTDFTSLTLAEMIEITRKAEEKRATHCRYAAVSYLRRKAKESGLTIEEYTATRDPRGCPRKYYPAGVFAPPEMTNWHVAKRLSSSAPPE